MVEKNTQTSTIWGPHPPSLRWLHPIGPIPPPFQEDNYTWGVGEEADLLTFLPIFDPSETKWTFADKIWNIPNAKKAPRRASPVTMGRFSKSLLNSIHDAQIKHGTGVVSEMTAPTFALWHGLKSVYVPHPLYADGKWSPKELDRIMNRGPAESINSGEDSLWNWDHRWDHVVYRTSYMFTAQLGEDLWRRWLGFKTEGEQFSDGSYVSTSLSPSCLIS